MVLIKWLLVVTSFPGEVLTRLNDQQMPVIGDSIMTINILMSPYLKSLFICLA